jgi:hypothetical protein
LRQVLRYVTGPEMKSNFISATQLETELLKAQITQTKRALQPEKAAADALLQLLRKTRRAAKAMRTK